MTFGVKMLRVLLFLGWTFMNVARHDKAWYHYKILQRCLCLLGSHAFVNFASAGDIINCIKTYLLQSIWQGQHVLVIKNDSGRAQFWSGNYISHHGPSTNVDSMAFPQTCQITRVRGRPERVPRSISKCNFVRRKTYVSSFGRWKPALPTMKPWRFLGYAEMNSFSIGLSGWAVFIWEEASYG